MKYYRSEYAFKQHKPHLTLRKKILLFFRKKKYTIAPAQDSSHYKSNPFRPRKKQSTNKGKIIFLAIFFTIWIVCLAYIPYFRVNKINYSGLKNTDKNDLNQFINENFLSKKSILPLNDYFFINTNKIASDLYAKFDFETVEVKKVFPNQLDVSVKEKISSIIYDNGKKYFLLDSEGTVIKYLKDVEPYEMGIKTATSGLDLLTVSASSTFADTSTPTNTSTSNHTPDYKKISTLFGSYPLVYDRRGLDVELKQENVLPAEHIATIIEWYKALNEQGTGKPEFFILDNLNSGVIIDTTNPWNILFQPKNDTLTQINNLKNTISTIKPKQYVDLRYGDKIYWK